MIVKTLVFHLTKEDLEKVEEITLHGVISGKLAKGDYIDDYNFAQVKTAYESCHQVNAALHSKLNRVRRALSHPELQTELPEDELDD